MFAMPKIHRKPRPDAAPIAPAVEIKKPSLRARAKSAIKSAAKAVVAPVRRAVAAVKRAVKRVVRKASASRVVAATKRFVRKIVPGLRAFARVFAAATALAVWLVLVATGPAVALIVTCGAALLLMGLAELVAYADRVGGVARRIVDILDAVLWYAGWTLVALFAVAFVTASTANAIAFAAMAFFWIAYRWPRETSADVAAAMWDEFDSVLPKTEATRIHEETRAKWAREQTGNDDAPSVESFACVACATTDGAIRINGWCKACFDALEEDFGERARKHRGSMLRLFPEDLRNHLHAVRASRSDADDVHWAETAWWVDNKAYPHPRTWTGFYQGSAIAHVDYEHHKERSGRVFHASLRDTLIGTFYYLDTAKEWIVDTMVSTGMIPQRAAAAPAIDVLQAVPANG